MTTIPPDKNAACDQIVLLHILDAAREAQSFCAGQSRSTLENTRVLLMALVAEIEVIGSMAAKVSEASRTQHPEIPWQIMIELSEHLIHEYFELNIDQIWNVLTHVLPSLITQLQNILVDYGTL